MAPPNGKPNKNQSHLVPPTINAACEEDQQHEPQQPTSKKACGKRPAEPVEDEKTCLITRVFSKDDEILLLEALIKYKVKNGVNPSSSNIVAFYDSVKHLLSCNVTKTQVADKIRRLKNKFLNTLRIHKGENPFVMWPYDYYKSFELSKEIWGSNDSHVVDGVNKEDGTVASNTRSKLAGKEDGNVASSNKRLNLVGNNKSNLQEKVKDKSETVAEEEDFWSLYPCLCASLESEAMQYFALQISSKEHVKQIISGLDKEKAKKIEEEWMGYYVMHCQVYVERAQLIFKQSKAVLDVIQS